MVFILRTYIPSLRNGKVGEAITKIKGVGKKRAIAICNELCINSNLRGYKLNKSKKKEISEEIAKEMYGQEIIKEEKQNIKRMIKTRSYKGFRHLKKLPVRGQRTHTNARTAKKR